MPSCFGATASLKIGHVASRRAVGEMAPVAESRAVLDVAPMATPTTHFLPSRNPDGTAVALSKTRQTADAVTSTVVPSGRWAYAVKHWRSRRSASLAAGSTRTLAGRG